MRWRGRRESSNVEDGRGAGGGGGFRLPGGMGGGLGGPGGFRIPVGGRGGGGIGSIILIGIVLLVFWFITGRNPIGMLTGGEPQQVTEDTSGASDEMKQFVGVVLAETEDVWKDVFQSQGMQYEEPTLRLFSGQVQSACGFASSATGPFYCPGDKKVYLDTTFFDQLAQQFQASGDFAQAYVIAHEVGHHVQNLTGILPKFNQARQQMTEAEANAMSVRVELQADCFAGVWGYYTNQKGLLEEGDIDEALNAAQQIGDDTLQKRTQGYVVPESFNHGTSQQRQRWFARGFKSGKIADCDTFNTDP
ncbi:MAG: neutral zinc metallopeptidase [Rhizobiaceae bacterium]